MTEFEDVFDLLDLDDQATLREARLVMRDALGQLLVEKELYYNYDLMLIMRFSDAIKSIDKILEWKKPEAQEKPAEAEKSEEVVP